MKREVVTPPPRTVEPHSIHHAGLIGLMLAAMFGVLIGAGVWAVTEPLYASRPDASAAEIQRLEDAIREIRQDERDVARSIRELETGGGR